MFDFWVIVVTCFAGGLIGFVSGTTNEPAAGYMTTGVTGFIAGILSTSFKTNGISKPSATAKLFFLYLLCLFLMYIIGNLFRRYGLTKWYLGEPVKK